MKSSVPLPSVTIREKPMEPLVQYIVPAILGVTAIILLIAGGRLLKPALGLSGFMVGVGAGLLIAPSISVQMSPLIIAGISGIICALICVFIAKFAIIVILGTSCAILTPYLTWQLTGLGDGKDATQVASEALDAAMATDESTQDGARQSTAMSFSAEKIVSQAFTSLWNEINNMIKVGIDRVNAAWDVIPDGTRLILIGSSITGLLLGLLVATFIPFTSSAIVTAAGREFSIAHHSPEYSDDGMDTQSIYKDVTNGVCNINRNRCNCRICIANDFLQAPTGC